jgi:hypothetical protein
MLRFRCCWLQGRQAESFAALVGGKVIEGSKGGRPPLIEIPEEYPRRYRDRGGVWYTRMHPTVVGWTHGGRMAELAAEVCNGEVFLVPGPSPFERYPSGNPVPLSGQPE